MVLGLATLAFALSLAPPYTLASAHIDGPLQSYTLSTTTGVMEKVAKRQVIKTTQKRLRILFLLIG